MHGHLAAAGVATMYAALGLMFAAIAVPLMLGRVPRNGWYGFRTPRTLASDDVWYPANRFMGRELFRAGLRTAGWAMLLALACLLLPIHPDSVAWIGLLMLCLPLVRALIRGIRFLDTL